MSAAQTILKRHVAAVVAGNALEFYDFLTYTFFAVYIGDAFFPEKAASVRLLLSLATFGAGFATRPLGGLVIGALGDRLGRKPAMFISFSLIGIAILGLAVTPPYARIGIAAPIIVVCLRLLQGFALGGEVGPTTAFLVEAAPPERRGLYGTLQSATQYAAMLAAGIVGSALAAALPHAQLAAWGWRIAFAIGAAIIPFGLIMRRTLPETMLAGHEIEPEAPMALVRANMRTMVLGIVLLASSTIATYVVLYLTTYAIATLKMPPGVAFGGTLSGGVCGVVCAALAGWASDRIGRKPVVLIAGAILFTTVIPAFVALNFFRTGMALYIISGLLTALVALNVAPVIVAIAESLPRAIRSGAFGTVYAISIAIFGGTAQVIVAWLVQKTGSPIAPAVYMGAALIGGLIAMMLLPESAPRYSESGSTARN